MTAAPCVPARVPGRGHSASRVRTHSPPYTLAAVRTCQVYPPQAPTSPITLIATVATPASHAASPHSRCPHARACASSHLRHSRVCHRDPRDPARPDRHLGSSQMRTTRRAPHDTRAHGPAVIPECPPRPPRAGRCCARASAGLWGRGTPRPRERLTVPVRQSPPARRESPHTLPARPQLGRETKWLCSHSAA